MQGLGSREATNQYLCETPAFLIANMKEPAARKRACRSPMSRGFNRRKPDGPIITHGPDPVRARRVSWSASSADIYGRQIISWPRGVLPPES